ncbi:ABC transporter substrate-binding protein [Paenibacillus oenotherae]|uniref:ABC transporter substrate-binding protein n=1 Tax=Paenibacillus oenotherae TaxID=1435645 RepID=A0ABS7D7X7_9BACL|nr:ABC transporter substrate-binding protein [Paenibacillus oenotherae]MBW7476045.1 ABC transporter substrate-binding protein [Paenibacillus oenotherae]
MENRARKLMIVLASLGAALLLIQGCSTEGGEKPPIGKADGVENKQATITIGYQSPTAQTWGALVIKNKQLFEKHLKELAPSDKVTVEWFDAPAGSVLNNNMNGGKIQLSFLGDMPSLLNGVMGISQANYRSVFLAIDGKGKGGRNQAIVVPNGSGIGRIEDLAGKTVSTPIGSSSHRMLLEALRKKDLVDEVTIVDQSVTIGMQSIEQNKIIAHSTWEPYPSLIQHRGIGQLLLPGEATEIDYLTGVVANRDWVEANKSYALAFLRALHEAHVFIAEHPDETVEIFQAESKFPREVCQRMVDHIRFDAVIYNKDVATLTGSAEFLAEIGKLKKKLPLESFIDDSYLREALASQGKAYLTDQELQGDWIEGKVY